MSESRASERAKFPLESLASNFRPQLDENENDDDDDAYLNLVRIHVGQVDAANIERRIGEHRLVEAHGVVEMVIVKLAG